MKKIVFTLMVLLFGFTLVACSKSTYTVSFNSNGGTTVESIKDVEEGSLITKPTDPTKDGSSFEGWFKETTLETEWKFSTDKVEDNITLYAKWKDNPTVTEKVNVTFQLNYAGSPSATVVKVDKGTKVSKPTVPTREDWEFLGWSTSATGQPNFDFNSLITKNTTLYGIWKTTLETVSVSFDADNGTDVTTKDQLVGELIAKFEDPVKADHIFLGWFNGEVEWNFATDLVEVEMTLKAKWQLKTREGTPISTSEELIELLSKKILEGEVYYLVQDIDMEGIEVPYFKDRDVHGEFDGQGFTISNLVFHHAGKEKMGLFATLRGGTIKNLTLDNFDIKSGTDRAAALVGEIPGQTEVSEIHNVTITNSKVSGNTSGQSAGGLVAYVNGPVNVSNIVIVDTQISGKQGVGGLFGHIRTGLPSTIKNVFVDVEITGEDRLGGLIGQYNAAVTDVSIENAVAISKIKGSNQNIGSLIGKADGKIVGTMSIKNAVGISEYSGKAVNNIGNVLGDGNAKIFTLTNVFSYVEGLPVNQSNGLDLDQAVTNIYTIFDESWWATNLKDLTENELWKKDVSGIYVMGDSTYVVPTHKVVTFKDGDNIYKYSVKDGSLINEMVLSKPEYEFEGWFLEGVLFDFSQTITEDITLIASWKKVTHGESKLDSIEEEVEGSLTLYFGYGLYVGEEKINLTTDLVKTITIKQGNNTLEGVFNPETGNILVDIINGWGTYQIETKNDGPVYEVEINKEDTFKNAIVTQSELEVPKSFEDDNNYYNEYSFTTKLEDDSIVELVLQEGVPMYNHTSGEWLTNKYSTQKYVYYPIDDKSSKVSIIFIDEMNQLYMVDVIHTQEFKVSLVYGEETETQFVKWNENPIYPSNTDQMFIKGWYTNEDLSELWNIENELTEHITLYADAVIGDLIFVSIIYEGLEDEIKLLVEDGKFDLSSVTRPGYEFVEAYLDEEMTNVYDDQVLITESITIWIMWEKLTVLEVTNLFYIGFNNDYFTSSSSELSLDAIEFEGVSITKQVKLDSSGFVSFETTTENAEIVVVIRERNSKDYGKGRFAIEHNGEKTVHNLTTSADGEVQVFRLTLSEIGVHKIIRDNNELGLYYVSVTEFNV